MKKQITKALFLVSQGKLAPNFLFPNLSFNASQYSYISFESKTGYTYHEKGNSGPPYFDEWDNTYLLPLRVLIEMAEVNENIEQLLEDCSLLNKKELFPKSFTTWRGWEAKNELPNYLKNWKENHLKTQKAKEEREKEIEMEKEREIEKERKREENKELKKQTKKEKEERLLQEIRAKVVLSEPTKEENKELKKQTKKEVEEDEFMRELEKEERLLQEIRAKVVLSEPTKDKFEKSLYLLHLGLIKKEHLFSPNIISTLKLSMSNFYFTSDSLVINPDKPVFNERVNPNQPYSYASDWVIKTEKVSLNELFMIHKQQPAKDNLRIELEVQLVLQSKMFDTKWFKDWLQLLHKKTK